MTDRELLVLIAVVTVFNAVMFTAGFIAARRVQKKTKRLQSLVIRELSNG